MPSRGGIRFRVVRLRIIESTLNPSPYQGVRSEPMPSWGVLGRAGARFWRSRALSERSVAVPAHSLLFPERCKAVPPRSLPVFGVFRHVRGECRTAASHSQSLRMAVDCYGFRC